MNRQEMDVHCRVGWLARVFGRAGCSEVRLTGGRLLLVGRTSGSSEYAATDLVPRVVVGRGLLWDSVRLSDRGGRPIRIGGLRRADAQALADGLERWFTPAKEAFFDDLERRLAEAEALVAPLVDGRRYVRHSELTSAAAEAGPLASTISDLLALSGASGELAARCTRLQQVLERIDAEVEQANGRFVLAEVERYSQLFDTVEAQPLTAAQRRACVVNDEHNLVLAGAGTGKTSVMIGRVAYLLAAGLAEPESILMVAYNRDAAEELRQRATRRLGSAVAERLLIKTFHALGVELIAEAEGVRPSVSELAGDTHALARFVTGVLEELLRDPSYAAKFINYGFDRREPYRSLFEFSSIEEYERELARLELRTLRGERVKSYEEVRIANFLTRNGIGYSYEEPFPVDTSSRQYRQYRPDFTIHRKEPGAGPVYLEHFGVDASGNPPPFFGEAAAKRYREQMAWKRELYREHGLPLIETYSHEFQSGVVFERLTERLRTQGIVLEPKSQSDCLAILRETGLVSETARFFVQLMPLVRDQALTEAEVESRIASLPVRDGSRARLLWQLLRPVLERYAARLRQDREIDFADMVRRATEYVRTERIRSPFAHVLVDEFQDISRPRAELILALTRSRPGSTFFCVGDDWQSIYRFTGSDIRYTSQFATLVGAGSTTRLDRTFRFNDEIGQVSSAFVMRNPAQVRKEIASQTVVPGPAVSLVRTAEPVLGVAEVLRRIDSNARAGQTRYSVYVLARYAYEFEAIKATLGPALGQKFPHLAWVRYSTVHAAKGQEADFVVVVGLEDGRNGFPADKPSDAFLEMFLPPLEGYPFAEERRLFYVALTRARHRVYLLYDAVAHSQFIRELKSGRYRVEEHEIAGDFVQADLPVLPCPRCETGEIRYRQGPGGGFYGCHRYPACRYTERGCGSCGAPLLRVGEFGVCVDPRCAGVHPLCPQCAAPMVRRNGPRGVFFGCSKYGSRDLVEQCSATRPWRQLPGAGELRNRVARSGSGL